MFIYYYIKCDRWTEHLCIRLYILFLLSFLCSVFWTRETFLHFYAFDPKRILFTYEKHIWRLHPTATKFSKHSLFFSFFFSSTVFSASSKYKSQRTILLLLLSIRILRSHEKTYTHASVTRTAYDWFVRKRKISVCASTFGLYALSIRAERKVLRKQDFLCRDGSMTVYTPLREGRWWNHKEGRASSCRVTWARLGILLRDRGLHWRPDGFKKDAVVVQFAMVIP